jgi:hypothetical protein
MFVELRYAFAHVSCLQLSLDEDGYIVTKPGTTQTSVEGKSRQCMPPCHACSLAGWRQCRSLDVSDIRANSKTN